MPTPVRSDALARAFAGRWALVTGASAGIGEALALDLAASGAHLVLTARRTERLEALAARVRADYGVEARVVAADLALPGAPQQIYDATEGAGLPIDILINNAGFGYVGKLEKGSAEWDRKMVDLNCAAVVHLTHLFLPRMIGRKRGHILIVASTASFQPVPYMATYAATKVFDRFFGEALAAEVRPLGVKVSALCPGPTESEFGQVAGVRQDFFRGAQTSAVVARKGLLALAAGRTRSLPSVSGAATVHLTRLLPRDFVTNMVERMFRKSGAI